MASDKQHAHELLDQLGPSQLDAVVKLLEVMTHQNGDASLTDEDLRAVTASREYFRQNPDGGVPFAQVVADYGFTMDEVRNNQSDR
jgi:hypothetical protein